MRFLFDEGAGASELEIKGDSFKHLKARRVRVGDSLEVRNLRDGKAHEYEIAELSRSAVLRLASSKPLAPDPASLAIAWAVIDEQSIEKTLPGLNELGVAKIIFVYSDFSQRDARLDLARFERILVRSSEQCGRNGIIKFEIMKSSDELAAKYANVALIDFGGDDFDKAISNLNSEKTENLVREAGQPREARGFEAASPERKDGLCSSVQSETTSNLKCESVSNLIFYVGAEGGFSERERELFPQKFGLKSENILRSVTAITAVAAKVLA